MRSTYLFHVIYLGVNDMLQQEIGRANLQALMCAQQMLNSEPHKAAQVFGLDSQTTEFIKKLTPSQIDKLAHSGVFAFEFRFSGKALDFLNQYLNGDDLALSQAVINMSGAK
jgi:flagellar transcriptional activator FlhD